MQLRPYQEQAINSIWHEWEAVQKTLLVLPTGCHAIGEQVMLSNGMTKRVEEVCEFDKLMGSDGSPRRILKIHTGENQLYQVTPTKGKPFIVTKDHKLTLCRTNLKSTPLYPSQLPSHDYVDVTVEEYLSWSKHKKHIYKLNRVKVNSFDNAFQDDSHTIDPYMIGVFLGDGGIKTNVNITTPEKEVVAEIKKLATKYGLVLRETPAGKATTYIFSTGTPGKRNLLKKDLTDIGIFGKGSGDKYIPYEYKCGNINTRKQILAGLIDTDGSLHGGNGYDYVSKSQRLANDVAFIARSLGLAAYVSESIKSCGDFTGIYYRVSISGDCNIIPCKVSRKKATPRMQKKNVLVTGFTVQKIGKGNYVGFTVDGDNRYLLDDFTVTHNCGKTICFAKVAEEAVRRGKRVLILAHREELLRQASDKIKSACGLDTATEKAEESCLDKWERIIVGSVQTLCRPKRLSLFSKTYFDVIIIDEAHHAISDSYQAILNYFDQAQVLGVTATPDRADMKNLGKVFDSLAFEYTLPKAIQEGYLSKIKVQTLPLSIDFTSVKITAGDFALGDIGRTLEPYLEQIADLMKDYMDRKIVVFLPLVEISKNFCRMLNERGFKAAEVNGKSENRNEITEDFANGKYNVLCNSMLLTEGWDCPSVDCVIVLRPTKSRALYCQMVGRGTRLSPGKEDLLILDFLWHVERHELCRPAHLIAKSDDVAKRMTEILEEKGMDLEECEGQAESDVLAQREEALAKELEAMRKKKARLVDPLQFEFSIQAEDLTNYTPSFGWQSQLVTPKQKAALEQFGINGDAIEDSGKASMLLDRLKKRKEEGLSTPKQIRFLENKGFKNVGIWTNDQASNMIGRISASGWRIPRGVIPATYKPA